jgi:signal transduction histidine kinase
MTQVDSDSLSARRTAIDAGQAVEQAVAALYAEPGGPIEVDFAELAGLDVLADPRHLHQILVNLLSNARKYGRPPVRVAVRRADGVAEIGVSDEGEGVPPDFVPLLFDRFSRASTGVAPTHKGTGLGLYIVDQLARANGGSVRYEPNEPRGSRFVVRVPLAPRDRSMGQNSKIGANVEV